jgi:hypothetical protein
MKRISFLDIICVLFLVLFVYAAVSKLLEFDKFYTQIAKSPLITGHQKWIVWAVPSVEIGVSMILFIPQLQRLALYCAFTIMFVFSAYIAFMLLFTPDLPCSCGGILNSMGWGAHLVFNIVFTMLAVVGIVLSNRQKKPEETQMPAVGDSQIIH